MFESKINRGRANGYAPLDGSGKVPLDKLPPIQSTIDTGSLVTINQTGSFATTSSLQTLVDATGSFATTGSNTFTGNQTITGNNGRLIYRGTASELRPTLAEIHTNDDYPWIERFHNDTFSTSSAVMAYFGWNDGRFVFHNESTQSIGLQVNGYSGENGLLVYSDKVAFVNNAEISGSLNIKNGNINVSGSVNISSSLVVSSTFVNSGSIEALNSDLIIDGGNIIVTGSIYISGSLIKSTVERIGGDEQPPLYLGDSTYSTALVDGNYGPFTLSNIIFSASVVSGIVEYTIIDVLNNAVFVVEETIGTLDASDLGGAPGNSSNIAVTETIPLALDVSKSIQKLTDGNYTLADGVEGQIMYLVTRQGMSGGANVEITVANFRDRDYAGPAGILQPFRTNNGEFVDNTGMCILIFTDGGWQQSSGLWI